MKKVSGIKTFKTKKFDLILNTGNYELSISQVRNLIDIIRWTLEVEEYNKKTTVSLSLVEPSIIKELNRDFRGKDKVTDVLSFPIDIDGGILGDVVLCPKRAKAQALLFGNSFTREMCYLTCHSILHLLGHDHMERLEKRLMRSKEKVVMKKFLTKEN